MVPNKKHRKEFEKIDYMAEGRGKRMQNQTASPDQGYHPIDWKKKILKTKDSKAKYDTLLQEVDKLER